MKKALLCIIGLLWLFIPVIVKAQTPTFTVTSDTVYATVSTTGVVYDNITNTTASGLTLHWHVIATSFTNDWLTPTAFGVCDNVLCRSNEADTLLWRTATHASGNVFTSGLYTPGAAETFDLSLDLTGASAGSHWVTIALTDANGFPGYTKNITFVINKWATAVSNVNNLDNGIVLYPNPVHDELNVVYNPNADIKTIAVYNIIGKVMMVYKVTNAGANLDLQNIPSGIYFVRLMNSHGDMVATKKFTKQ